MVYGKRHLITAFFLVLVVAVFLIVGLDFLNKARDPAFEDTGSYLEGALFIKENGGVSGFLPMCLTGKFKIAEQHPLPLLLLSTFASRDLSFFTEAKLLSLFIGLLFVVVLFFATKNLFGQSVAFLSSFLMVFNIAFLVRSSNVTVEPLLMLFLLLSWFFMVKGLDSNRLWILAGISTGLAYMTKGPAISMIPIFVISNLIIFRLRILKNLYFWLFFLFFLLSASPLILRNVIVYSSPFYEGINPHVFWLDSFGEFSKYLLSVNWSQHTYNTVSNMPTLHSYLQTHSFEEIVKRIIGGAIGEFKLLVNGLNLLIIPKGRMYFSLILFFFFLIGLISEIRKKRTIYTIAVLLVFFIPFAWIYQVLPVVRYVTPIIPFMVIYSSLGVIETIRYLDSRLSRSSIRLLPKVPYVLMAVLILFAGYYMATKKVSSPLHSANIVLSDDQVELFNWLRENVGKEDFVLLGPTNHYWGYLWYAGFKGKLVPTSGNVLPLDEENMEVFSAFLRERNVNVIVLHRENYNNPAALKGFFEYHEGRGLIEKKPVKNWELIYSYSKRPTEFLIYRIKGY